MKIAFIGLGNMGLPMARNLAAAGNNVNGFDPAFQSGNTTAETPFNLCSSVTQALDGCSLVLTMLPDGPVVLDVLDRIIAHTPVPPVMMDCSTIDINDARTAHVKAAQAGIDFLDAPVSGGIAGAANGTLTGMVGGDETVLDSMKGTLSAVFKTLIYCGSGGSGQAAKICNNMLLATSMIGTGEAFNLGRKLGLDMNTLFSVLSTSTGSCWSVNSYCPVPGVGPQSPADNAYQPGFSGKMMLKDMRLTQNAASSVQQATPLGAEALAHYQRYVDQGGAEEDFSGIIRYLDTLERTDQPE